MAVYEQSYKPYDGPLTPDWSRFLIIPRHTFRAVFNSKLFTGFFVICFLPVLVEAILIYLHHNVNALGLMQLQIRELIPIDASFFQFFVNLQGGFAFFVALLVGPPLVSRDLRNNALPLYLCRPFSRTEYVMGKMSVVLILLSIITWVPQLLLFLFQAYLQGFAWFKSNLWIASAILIGSAVWIILLALLSQAVSALVKWRVVASAVLLAIFFIPSVFGEFINVVFQTRYGSLVSIGANMKNVQAGLFGTFDSVGQIVRMQDMDDNVREVLVIEPPLWISWTMIFMLCALCLGVLSWKIKAYEVVR